MTSAMRAHVDWATAGARELRVATLRGGRLGDEARHAEQLRVGPTERADVVIRGVSPALLFERREDGWWLHRVPGMTGRVATGAGGVRSVEALFAEVGERVRLTPDARGRLALGDASILFQLVPPRPAPPRRALPASVRGGALEIDWRFSGSLAVVATLVFGLLLGLEGADWPVRTSMAALDPLIVRPVFDEPTPPPEPVDERASEETTDEAESEPSDGDPRVARRDDGAPSRPSDAAPSLDPNAIGAIAQEAVVTTLGSGGAFETLIEDGMPTGELQAILDGVQGVEQYAAGQHVARDGGGGSGETDGIGAIADRGPVRTIDSGSPVEESRVRGPDIAVGPIDSDGGYDFDQDAFVRRLRGIRRRVQRCYEREVTRDPSLEGRVDLEVDIHPAGNVSARITRDGVGSRRVAQCITDAASSIRFAKGPEGTVTFAFPFIFSAQR